MTADVDLAFAGLARQAELVRAREVSSTELVDLALDRIATHDGHLNAFRVVFAEQALAAAEAADARDGDERGPLHGVPVAVKDDMDVGGEVTMHGSDAHDRRPAAEDGEVVRRLRAAGAIVIGKTNVPELTIVPFTESPTFGCTRNPWDPYRTPGGSSGGSGAAVAAGMVPAALASDGAGSIRIPAAFCGLYGLKPQRGRVSTAPHPEIWHGMSVYGALTRTVADTALLLDALAGNTDADPVRPPAPERPFAEAARTVPGPLRIAVSTAIPRGVIARLGEEQKRAVHETAELLRGLGHAVDERDPDYGAIAPRPVVRYLRGIHDAAMRMPHPERLSRRTRSFARLGGLITPAMLQKARAREAADTVRLGALWDTYDVLLTPTVTGPPFRIGEADGRGALWTLNRSAMMVPHLPVFNHTGQPAASVPAGFDRHGLPLAVQLVGRPNDEATLLSLSAQLETARPWADRRPPLS